MAQAAGVTPPSQGGGGSGPNTGSGGGSGGGQGPGGGGPGQENGEKDDGDDDGPNNWQGPQGGQWGPPGVGMGPPPPGGPPFGMPPGGPFPGGPGGPPPYGVPPGPPGELDILFFHTKCCLPQVWWPATQRKEHITPISISFTHSFAPCILKRTYGFHSHIGSFANHSIPPLLCIPPCLFLPYTHLVPACSLLYAFHPQLSKSTTLSSYFLA